MQYQSSLGREGLVDLALQQYFANVDKKDLDAVLVVALLDHAVDDVVILGRVLRVEVDVLDLVGVALDLRVEANTFTRTSGRLGGGGEGGADEWIATRYACAFSIATHYRAPRNHRP